MPKPMREYLTVDDNFSEILMQRTADSRTIFIVEGVTDWGIMTPFVCEEKTDLKEYGGKPAALAIMKLCNENSVGRVIALVDSDFDRMPGGNTLPDNVILTDHYDLESTIIRSGDVLRRFISNHFDYKKVCETEEAHGVGVHEIAERIGKYVGYARYVVKMKSLPISLQSVPIESFIDFRSMEIKIENLIRAVSSKVEVSDDEIDDVMMAVRGLDEKVDNLQAYAYCRGHDLVQIISILGRKKWRSNTGADQAERALRSSFDRDALEDTKIYDLVQSWCELHKVSVWKPRRYDSSSF